MASVALETASDDWFADFDDDGLPDLAVGRLPVRTVAQADSLVHKITGYETQPAASWTEDVTLVADNNDSSNDFETASRSLAPLLPDGYRPHEVFRGALGSAAGAELAAEVSSGSLVVNYLGHGSTRLWGKAGDLLSNDMVASSWQSDLRLPFVVAMNCLNGFFHGVYDEESLAEALLRAPDGGAVAAWASSGLTSSATQQLVSRELFRLLFRDGTLTLGEAAALAKQVVAQHDVRHSWVFFGDPATRLLGVHPTKSEPVIPEPGTSPVDPTPVGSMPTGETIITAVPVRRMQLADFDGDGRADLLAYRPDTGEWQTGTDMDRFPRPFWSLGLDVQAANFDGDQLADLFLYDPLRGKWFELLNNGQEFVRTATGVTLAGAEVRFGDLDGDGRDDVVVYQPATGDWSVGINASQGGFVFTGGAWEPQSTLRIADFDGDGFADIFGYQRASGNWRLVFSNPNGPATSIDGTTGAERELSIANLDNNGRADLLFYDRSTGAWEGWRSVVPGGFAVDAAGTWATELALQLADVTGDGRDEALLYAPLTGAWAVTPTTAGAAPSATGVAPAWATLASGDIDDDGLAELYLTQPQAGTGVLLKPQVGGALLVKGTDWPAGWAPQGYVTDEPFEVAIVTPEMSLPDPMVPVLAAGSNSDPDVWAALQMLGLQIAPSQNNGRVNTSSEPPSIEPAPVAAATVGRPTASALDAAPATVAAQAPPVAPARTKVPETAARPASGNVARYAVWVTGESTPAKNERHEGPKQAASPEPAAPEETPAPQATTVATKAATKVSGASAILHGSIRQGTAGTSVGFLWGADNPPTTSTTLKELDAKSASFEASLTDLDRDTVYYFRSVVEELGGGRLLGEVRRFRTSTPAVPAAKKQ